jgi:hypothetical protein
MRMILNGIDGRIIVSVGLANYPSTATLCSDGQRQSAMAHDISDAILSHISNFAVGLVIREEGKGSRVLGSGVLVSIEGRRGILTCGHVAEAYEKLLEIGLIRFVAGVQQRRVLRLGDTQTIILQSADTFEEKKEVLDLAFTLLPPEAASSIEAHGVFLNIEKNRTKMEALAPTEGKHVPRSDLSRSSRRRPSLKERSS